MNLENKVALVTGAASGIGRAIAVGLAEAGATVAAVDRDAEGLAATVNGIGGERARAHRADLGEKDAILALRTRSSPRTGSPTSS